MFDLSSFHHLTVAAPATGAAAPPASGATGGDPPPPPAPPPLAVPAGPAAAVEGGGAQQEQLLRRVQTHDPEGWRLLLDLYGPVVHSWCRRSGLQAQDVADIVQDVFCALMRRVSSFRLEQGNGGLRGWIWTITQNKLRDYYRRRARLPLTGAAYEHFLRVPQPETPVAESAAAVARAEHELFHRALLVLRTEFEERTWQAFWRSVVDGQESTAVGAELHMTANAVRKAKSRVLKRLRQQLNLPQEGEDDEDRAPRAG